MTLGEKIKKRRQELGLSVADVATAINKSVQTIYRYENGGILTMSHESIAPLAKVLQTTPGELLINDNMTEENADFFADILGYGEVYIEHIKVLSKLSAINQQYVFDIIDMLKQKEGL